MRRWFGVGWVLAGCAPDPIVGTWEGDFVADLEGMRVNGTAAFTAAADGPLSGSMTFLFAESGVEEEFDDDQEAAALIGEWARLEPDHARDYVLTGTLGGTEPVLFAFDCAVDGAGSELECDAGTVDGEDVLVSMQMEPKE